jgi:hypothetical protein
MPQYNLPHFFLFLDYDKAYSKINQTKFWAILSDYALLTILVNAAKSLYDNTSIVFNKKIEDVKKYP